MLQIKFASVGMFTTFVAGTSTPGHVSPVSRFAGLLGKFTVSPAGSKLSSSIVSIAKRSTDIDYDCIVIVSTFLDSSSKEKSI
ncbi:hypothetical protein BJV82DRAFT_638303 [Fennellomyces sp. T-0311]|nr:hypothetical protein BJV82DRAFT_638303 [Fennellomyces sp. T-0311]